MPEVAISALKQPSLVALSYQLLRGFAAMRALLICPEFPLSFWSFRKSCQLRGNRTVTPPLGLLTLAALLPPEWELRLADLNTRELTEADWQWADLIMISAMYIQRDGRAALVKEAKQRGKT